MPKILGERTVSAERIEKASKKMVPVAEKLDEWFYCRLPQLVGTFSNRAASVCCILLCLTVPPLEFVPFASAAPMAAIAVFGMAMTVRDGALMLGGFILTAVAFIAGFIIAT